MALNRRGLLAAVLSFVYPGLGHLYLRAWLRALAWFGLSIGTAALLMPPELITAFQEQGLRAFSTTDVPADLTLSLLAVRAFNIIDAYLVAVRQAEPEEPDVAEDEVATCPNCGRELDEDLDFCPWCTHELDRTHTESR